MEWDMDLSLPDPLAINSPVTINSPCLSMSAEQWAVLQSFGPLLLDNLSKNDFATFYNCMVTPTGSPPENMCHCSINGETDLEDLHPSIDAQLAAIQRHLDILTQARGCHDALHGEEGDGKPMDPVDLLLAFGLNVLLHKFVSLIGPSANPAVLVTFNSLTFRPRKFSEINAITAFCAKLWHALPFWRPHHTPEKYILKDITGSFRPGKMTLILGPPQSGKSSLMKAIAGRLGHSKLTQLRGSVEYAGRQLPCQSSTKKEIQLVKLVGYVPQTDKHMPTLTVRETIQFAQNCTTRVSPKKIVMQSLTDREIEEVMLMDRLSGEILMAQLGIRHVGDTIVGSETLRGISGGQRKRLTAGEIMVTFAPVLLADEISTGLDSATTFEICNALRACAQLMRNTIVVSLLQPTPETYATFDEVLVMAAGQIAYQGPREQVLSYFEELRFRCPLTKSAAEFLQEVTLPGGMELYRISDDCETWEAESYRPVIKCPEDFGPVWQSSNMFRIRMEEDMMLYESSKIELDNLHPDGYVGYRMTRAYTCSLLQSTWLCICRQAKVTARDKEMAMSRVTQVLFVGLLLGSLYFQIPKEDYNAKLAVLFYVTEFVSVCAFASFPKAYPERQVVMRQLDAHFFPPSSYGIAISILDVPIAFLEILAFCSIVYWMCGFSPELSNFVNFTFVTFFARLVMGALLRLIAQITPAYVIGNACAGALVLIYVLHTGYFLAREDVKAMWLWAYWVNPIQWAMTALSLIEFKSNTYSTLLDPTDPSKGTVGDFYLGLKKMPTDDSLIFWSYIFNALFCVVLVVLYIAALRFVHWPDSSPPRPVSPPTDVPAEEAKPIPFQPCCLAWHDVCYDVDLKEDGHTKKLGLRLLTHVNGFAKPGTLTALMGSSGAGKTTLLDVLAGRKNTGLVTGDILLNGQSADPITFSRMAGYVEQQDIHSPTSTVLEALMFSAMLRLPRETPVSEKKAHAWQVLVMLNLRSLAHCRIGTPQKGLTVEQVKRVTIGVEMAANPAILFLDEPTSGLDSMAADTVMAALQSVVRSGRTLVCTIHQPSFHLFCMFQHLLLLTGGGKVVFFGETGHHAEALVAYFNAIPNVIRHIPPQNPATWMLNAIATKGVDFAAVYKESALCAANGAELQVLMQRTGEELTSGHRYQATTLTQFRVLLKKWMLLYWRSPSYVVSRLVTCLFIALVTGSIFWRTTGNDLQSVFARAGSQFIAFIYIGIIFGNLVQAIVTTERPVFYRERASHMYRPWILNTVVGLCEIPYLTISILVFTVPFYWMVGLEDSVDLFFFWFLILWLYAAFNTFFGFAMGCLMPNIETATVMMDTQSFTALLLGGLMISRDAIPWWWRWLHYSSPMSYALQGIMSTQFYCEAAETDPLHANNCPVMTVYNAQGVPETVTIWGYIKESFSMDYSFRWGDVGILICMVILARITSALALQFVNHAKR